MGIKIKLYKRIVNRVPAIKRRYEQYVGDNRIRHLKFPIISWCYLMLLYIRYFIFQDKELADKKKNYPVMGSESEKNKLEADELIEELSFYDIISFDVFDTLIFRPFADPKDIFYLVGERLDCPNFRNIRINAEQIARQRCFEKCGSYEADIRSIYSVMEELTGIPAEIGMNTEFSVETELCFRNPFMKKVYDGLIQKNKKIVITTDMYLNKNIISELLFKCGFEKYERLYASCDEMAGKHDGEIWRKIKEDFPESSFVHIGDDPLSDVRSAQKNGIKAVYYPNINRAGKAHRPEMSPLIGSAYRGIVNAHLCNGLHSFSVQYEYGYICGGLMILGFCQYIHKLAAEKNADIILFFSRDGFIVMQIYEKLYPDEKTEYVYWSRAAAAKLGFEYFRHDYFRRFIYQKVGKGHTMAEIFTAMELDCADFGIDENLLLTAENAVSIVKKLTDNRDKIAQAYSDCGKAAKIYFSEMLSGCKTALAVDCGWSGSGYIILEKLIREEFGLDTELFGVIAAANGKYQAESDYSEMYFKKEMLYSYCFSSDKNRSLFELHNAGLGHNIFFEMLMSADHPGFTGFKLENNTYKLCFEKSEESDINRDFVKEIHRGIFDFADEYTKRFKDFPYMLNISGQDAYAPFEMCLKNNGAYPKLVLKNCKFSEDVCGRTEKIG